MPMSSAALQRQLDAIQRMAGKTVPAFNPCQDRPAVVAELLKALEVGATLRAAAGLAGVHVATVCRWQRAFPVLRDAIQAARQHFRAKRREARPPRPAVEVHPDCPRCGGAVEVRAAGPGIGPRFWRCRRWPECSWVSWRPRAPGACPRCAGPWFWSHSRRSIGCPACGYRAANTDPVCADLPRTVCEQPAHLKPDSMAPTAHTEGSA